MNKGLAFLATLLLFPAAGVAQDDGRSIADSVSFGAALGVSRTGHDSSGGGRGPSLSGHVDIPAGNRRVRLSAGHARWSPTNDNITQGAERAGRVGLSRAGITLLRPVLEPTRDSPVGLYGGIGVGLYRYHIAHGSVANRRSRGVHALGGFEYLTRQQRRALRIELELHAAGGPGHDQVWAYTVFALSTTVGISHRF